MIMMIIQKTVTIILTQTLLNNTFAQNVGKSVMTWKTLVITSSKFIIHSINSCKALVYIVVQKGLYFTPVALWSAHLVGNEEL